VKKGVMEIGEEYGEIAVGKCFCMLNRTIVLMMHALELLASLLIMRYIRDHRL
jgi:hypothetical protein